jgi:uncharacterized DUF497 family protein
MNLDWSNDKNELVTAKTGVSFEDAELAIATGGLLDDIQHPNTEKYKHQRIMIVAIDGYAYAVPYVKQTDGSFFLKTLYPNRYYTRKYLT